VDDDTALVWKAYWAFTKDIISRRKMGLDDDILLDHSMYNTINYEDIKDSFES